MAEKYRHGCRWEAQLHGVHQSGDGSQWEHKLERLEEFSSQPFPIFYRNLPYASSLLLQKCTVTKK